MQTITDNLARKANDRIAGAAQELGVEGHVPFLCECGAGRCAQFVLLPLEDYAELRKRPAWFLVMHGHERETDQIVAEHGRYLLVEKA